MTEQEWLASDDPREMLDRMPSTPSERKCRLLICALLRRANPVPGHPALASVALGERWADGEVTEEEVWAFQHADPTANWAALAQPAHALPRLCANALGDGWRLVPDLLRELFGNPFQPAAVSQRWLTPAVTALAQAAYDERLLPSGDLDPVRTGVLADALEEAGCASAELLAHLRSGGAHVLGCWALDLALGRE